MAESTRPRARDLGIVVGTLPPGPHDAITDVPGVKVGVATLIEGEGPLVPGKGPVRTGVTAILPCPDPWAQRLPAAAFLLNGNGEMTGLAYINDIGRLESPIMLTNTLNVGRVYDATISWLVRNHPAIGVTDDVPVPVVAECDDSTLNDIQGRHVGEKEVFAALDGASDGAVPEGNVGGGTGMICYELKGGTGTASRVAGPYTVGVLVQANHGLRSELNVLGRNVGPKLHGAIPERRSFGSIIMVVATDAPLSQSQLSRLARHAAIGLARTGSIAHHGSGDLVLAFSTANAIERGNNEPQTFVAWPDQKLDPLYQATVEASEESIYNALLAATTMTGRDDTTVPAIDPVELRRLLD